MTGIMICLCLIVVWVVVLLASFGNIGRSESGSGDEGSPTTAPVSSPVMTPTTPPAQAPIDGSELLPSYTWEVIQRDGWSPQWQAWEWLNEQDLTGYTDDELLQRYAVATFYFATDAVGGTADSMWIDADTHECTWYGFECYETLWF